MQEPLTVAGTGYEYWANDIPVAQAELSNY